MLVCLRDGSAQTIFMCCYTEIEVADQTFHLTQSQYTDTGPTSPSTDPITPGAWQGSQWSSNSLSHWYNSTPKKSRRKRGSNPGSSTLEADALTTRPTRRLGKRTGASKGERKMNEWVERFILTSCRHTVQKVCKEGLRKQAFSLTPNDDDDNRIESRNSTFVYCPQCAANSLPTRTLKSPGCYRVQITCNTSSAHRVQHDDGGGGGAAADDDDYDDYGDDHDYDDNSTAEDEDKWWWWW